MVSSDAAIISFSDAGAHLRNMAFYNFPLQMLKLVKDAKDRGKPFMTMERAVHRVTGELADWFGLDTGTIEVGKKADCVLINPEGLNQDVLEIKEDIFEEMNGIKRLVNCNEKAVEQVLINGTVVFENNQFINGYGENIQTGEFLESK